MSTLSGSGPAVYTGDRRGLVLPADYLIATQDDAGALGVLPDGTTFRRPRDIYAGSGGVHSLGPIVEGASVAITAAASPFNAQGYGVVLVDATTGPVTVTLPASVVNGQKIYVVKTDASANAVTVSAAPSTINGAASVSLSAQYAALYAQYLSGGPGWFTLSSSAGGTASLATVTPVTAAMSPYIPGTTNQTLTVDATAGAVVLNLVAMTAPLAGLTYQIKRIDDTVNLVAVNVFAGDAIDGGTSFQVIPYASYTVQGLAAALWGIL